MQDEFRVGDLILAYHKGFWRITKIDYRYVTERDIKYYSNRYKKVGDKLNSILHYELVMNDSFVPPKKKAMINSCDESYCTKITKEYIFEEVKKLESLLRYLG